MAKMGSYCKAYTIDQFRQFEDWTENLSQLRKEKRVVDGKSEESPRELGDGDHFYLQETYVVTDDIFLDENIIFDAVTPRWIDFCKTKLGFEIPNYDVPNTGAAPETEQSSASQS